MKLATKIIAAFAIGATSVSASHAAWEPIDDTLSWNTDSVRIIGNERTVFLKKAEPGKSPNGKRFTMVVISQTINCRSISWHSTSIAFFDGQGNRVDGAEIPLYAQHEETIYPGTIAENIAQSVCARAG